MNRPSDTPQKLLLKIFSSASVLKPALVSSLLCFLTFPPVGWAWLIWLAPIGWLSLVQGEELPGRRPYRGLWVAGLIFWLLTIHWLRKPHWVNYIALPVLASYLAVYLPIFVALSRVGVHRLRLPLWLVAPVAWTGLDLARAHLMTGFLMGSLAHTQVDFPVIIQIANLTGEYGVTFLIMLVAACLTQCLRSVRSTGFGPILTLKASAPAILAILATLLYGRAQDATQNFAPQESELRVALIQGNTLAHWKADPDRQSSIMQEYAGLTSDAVDRSRREGKSVDLIIWPETAYRYALFTVEPGYQPPADFRQASDLKATQVDLANFALQTGAAFLTGLNRVHVLPDRMGQPTHDVFNSSALINKQGELVGTYNKMHLLIMGEYVPFTQWFPILERLTPMTGFAEPGISPQALETDGFICCPNICYETAVPHLIRRQVQELVTAKEAPDVLVNLTNDAWFWGSSQLDMHLACSVFRAVETRTPLVAAANGGLSAHIDAYGRVQQVAPRQQTATLLVDLPARDDSITFYVRYGDWFAGLCLVCCIVLTLLGWRSRSSPLPSPDSATT